MTEHPAKTKLVDLLKRGAVDMQPDDFAKSLGRPLEQIRELKYKQRDAARPLVIASVSDRAR